MKSPESLKHAVCTNTLKHPVDTCIKQIKMAQKKCGRQKKATLKICEEKNQKSFQKDTFCLAHFVNASTTQAHNRTTFQRLKLLHTITALASNGKPGKMARQTLRKTLFCEVVNNSKSKIE